MKAIKPSILLLLTCFETLASFSQKNTLLYYVPRDAKMIIKLNCQSLGQKMKWDEFAKTRVFDEITKDVSEEGKAFLKNPGTTGIDQSQGIFVVMRAEKGTEKSTPTFYGVLKDPSQFSATITKLTTEQRTVKIANGKLLISKKTAVAWNKEIFIITENDSKDSTAYPDAKAGEEDDLAKEKKFAERCKTLLNKQKVPFSNEQLIWLLKEQGDVYLWVNNLQPSSEKKTKAPQIVSMFNKNMIGSSNYTTAAITFENGKIDMQMKRYISASLDSLYRKYPARSLNTELAKKLPAGHPIILYSFSFSPAMINEIMVKAGADKYMDSLSKKKIKMEDIVAAITGDVTGAMIKVDDVSETDSITRAMNGLQIFLAGGIKDKTKFKEFSDLLQTEKKDTSSNQKANKMKPLILSKDSVFVLSFSQNAAQKFLESTGNNDEIKKLITPYANYPNACFIDLRTILGLAMQGSAKNRSEGGTQQTPEVLRMFDKFVSYGGQYNNGFVSSTLEITLNNKDENSLKQFINLFELFNSMRNKKSSALKRTPLDVQSN